MATPAEAVVAEYSAILDAVATGDPAAAVAALERHLAHARTRLLDRAEGR
ncbi:FCD domain-containing protein [Nocardia goodfellowii]